MSPFILLDRVSFSYDKSLSPVLEDLNISFDVGWTAVCGANGCGKSTLLHLIQQDLNPDRGLVKRHGHIGFLRQDHGLTSCQMEELFEDYSKKALRLKRDLELDALFLRSFSSLSPGEQKRMCLAFLLRQELDILLVDEPTNHADQHTKGLLLHELKRFNGIGIMVSHDREMLNGLASKTVFLDDKKAISIDAPFSLAVDERVRREDHQRELRENQLQAIKRRSKSLQRKSEMANKKAKCLSKRGVAKKDHDQKDRVNRARLFGADKNDSRAQKVYRERLARSVSELANLVVKKEYHLGAFFEPCSLVKPIFFEEQRVVKNHITIETPPIVLRAQFPVAIVGKNGSGKTTLLSHLASICPIKRFTHIPQELSAGEKQALYTRVRHSNNEDKARVLSLIRRLGSDPGSMADGLDLSPGLWQKMALAFAVLDSHPLMMLDEPTNHMDLTAIDLLERALKGYGGAVLLVSHDKEFVKNVCVEKIELVRHGSCARAEFVK